MVTYQQQNCGFGVLPVSGAQVQIAPTRIADVGLLLSHSETGTQTGDMMRVYDTSDALITRISSAGDLMISDAGTYWVTFAVGTLAANRTFTLPAVDFTFPTVAAVENPRFLKASAAGATAWGVVPASVVSAGTFTDGAFTFPSTLTVTGALTLSSTTDAASAITCKSLVTNATLDVSTAATFNSTIDVTGVATLTGHADLGSKATLAGSTISSGTHSYLAITSGGTGTSTGVFAFDAAAGTHAAVAASTSTGSVTLGGTAGGMSKGPVSGVALGVHGYVRILVNGAVGYIPYYAPGV